MLAGVEEPGGALTDFGYTDGLLTQVRGVLANDLLAAGKITDTPAALTSIDYSWVQPATAGAQDNIRPGFVAAVKSGGVYPQGSIPLVTAVTGPAPDGATAASQPKHSYDYTVDPSTTKVAVAGVVTTAATLTYDATGRTKTSKVASNPASRVVWDPAGKDLPVASTDPAGRMSTTVYDWADRATDTYGPAPAACFDQTGRPVVTPPPGVVCGVIPHTHTGFDTDSTGQRVTGLSLDQYDNLNLSGQPMKRTTTASWDASGWPLTAAGSSSRLSGEVALPAGGHTFSAVLGNTTDDGIRVYVGDRLVIDRWWTLRQAVKADQPTVYLPGNAGVLDPAMGATETLENYRAVTFNGPPVANVGAAAVKLTP